ncbi:SDR family NAD(P)-dependent oxidoreductase [Pseudomonas sp. NFIX28]|uniref:SDR family NAD(P)-dependent oxidoreductase n=1 Tax=Pseudomonas sp. NFIX28 TaxID=1566235 RepID=UPI000B840F43|nr:SDR family NAD(P)-dependent oxidoreductase [Pseudomonas sp. NFIX28]
MNILVTGCAGFIGSHVARRLCQEGHQVLGLDNLNGYYAIDLKLARLDLLMENPRFQFRKQDIADTQAMRKLFDEHRFDRVVHLAAQAGVRYSIDNPHVYVDSNLQGFVNILEGCRRSVVGHLLYASSSSVYGISRALPLREDAPTIPVSLYAVSKRANEMMAHSYAHLFGQPATGLRLFTVYGPWGRPDMAPFKFTQAMLEGWPIDLYNGGNLSRDFTYIDDVVEGIVQLLNCIPCFGPKSGARDNDVPHATYNIGFGTPSSLAELIGCIESATGASAIRHRKRMQPGDVYDTWADVSALEARTGFRPKTPLPQGIDSFVQWYRTFYRA